MESKLAVLPCNGLDKCAGCVSHEVALRLAESAGAEIICPVLLREADARYKRLADELPLVVVDGCATRCASKLAAEKGLKAALKSNVAQEAKDAGLELPAALRLDEATEGFARDLAKGILDELEAMDSTGDNSESEGDAAGAILPADISYETFTVGEVEFRLPAYYVFLGVMFRGLSVRRSTARRYALTRRIGAGGPHDRARTCSAAILAHA